MLTEKFPKYIGREVKVTKVENVLQLARRAVTTVTCTVAEDDPVIREIKEDINPPVLFLELPGFRKDASINMMRLSVVLREQDDGRFLITEMRWG
jgi:hypothetical protein